MRILLLSWRDIKNPKSGGAEILTQEIAKRLVKWGNKVDIFSSAFSKGKTNESIDGVSIIRRGHPDARFLFSSVHFSAFKYYRENKNKYDVVIDEVHGIPFLTPWYVKKRKVVLICEVAGDLWLKMFGLFFGVIGRLIEKLYLKYIYKDIPYLTISPSTKEELIKEGVSKENITVLPMGVTLPKKINKVEKEKEQTLIYVGRLSKSKGIEDAIKALGRVTKVIPEAKLWIVGSGEKEYANFLKEMAKKLKINHKVIFFGFVSNERKFNLMGRAHILLVPSAKEGFGLIVPEAARVGTPSVVYDVPGLRDIVTDRVNGIKLKKNTPDEIAKEVINLLKNDTLYRKLQSNAKETSLLYNWDKTARTVLEVLKQ